MRKRWILCGSFLFLSAALAAAAVFRMGENTAIEQQAQEAVIQVLAETQGNSWYGEEYCAVLEIGDLELVLPVLDHYTEADMKRTPCLYSGSLETGDVVITAHNYRHHFGRLGELAPGAELTLRTQAGENQHYQLAMVEELSPTDVEAMIHSGYPLTLYTCTYDQRAMLTLRWEYIERDAE